MEPKWGQRAKRVAGELLVIVVGVLLALEFEGLRDERENRSRERAGLGSLRSDLVETSKRLDEVIVDERQTVEAQRGLLALAESDAPLPAEDSLGVLVSRSFLYWRLEPLRGTYDALLGSGEWRLIRSDSLRGSLSALFGTMGNGFEDEALSTALRKDLILAVSETGALPRYAGSEFRAVVGLPPIGTGVSYGSLLQNPRYLAALMGVAATETFELQYFEDLRSQLDLTLGALNRELGK